MKTSVHRQVSFSVKQCKRMCARLFKILNAIPSTRHNVPRSMKQSAQQFMTQSQSSSAQRQVKRNVKQNTKRLVKQSTMSSAQQCKTDNVQWSTNPSAVLPKRKSATPSMTPLMSRNVKLNTKRSAGQPTKKCAKKLKQKRATLSKNKNVILSMKRFVKSQRTDLLTTINHADQNAKR